MVKTRRIVWFSRGAKEKMDRLQKEIMKKKGEKISSVDLSDKIMNDPNFEAIEQRILGNEMINFNIKFDKRRII